MCSLDNGYMCRKSDNMGAKAIVAQICILRLYLKKRRSRIFIGIIRIGCFPSGVSVVVGLRIPVERNPWRGAGLFCILQR